MRTRCEYDAPSTVETTVSLIRLRTRSRAPEGSPNHLCSLTPTVRSYNVGLVAGYVTFRCAMAIH